MEKWAKVGPTIPVPEKLVIHTLTSSEPPRPRPEAVDTMESQPLEEGPERTVQLGYNIAPTSRLSLVSFLRECKDVFAFRPEEMPSIASTVMEHRLNADVD